MRYRKIWKLIRSAIEAWLENRGPGRGAALAFYTLFSIAPILIIATSIAGFFLGDRTVRSSVVEQSRTLVGEQAAGVIKSILERSPNQTSNFFAGIIGLVAMFVGATSVFMELKDALDHIWKVEAKSGSGILSFIRTRLLALVIILAMTLLIMVSILVGATMHAILNLGGSFILEHSILLEALNFLFLFAMSTLLFATIYKVLPSVKIEWEDVWVGAAMTAVLFTIGKTLIGFYLYYSATASLFGAAGSLILLLFWVYYSSQIFLLGAEFTKLYAYNFGSRSREHRV